MTSRTLTAAMPDTARLAALRLGCAAGFALGTAAAARIAIPLPFTPVPITAQTAVVLLSGALLGGGWGAASMALYLAAGALGAPFFADGESGSSALIGPTGGYLLAFLLVPPVVGRALPPSAGFARALVVLLAASGVILLWGMLQLALSLGLPLGRAFALGVAPFLAGDLVKVAGAAAVFRAGRGWACRLRS